MDDLQKEEETQKQAAIVVAEAESALQAVLPFRGQGVHYVTSDYSQVGGEASGVHVGGMAEAVYDGGVVDLRFLDFTASGVAHDESKAPGTWHFIEV